MKLQILVSVLAFISIKWTIVGIHNSFSYNSKHYITRIQNRNFHIKDINERCFRFYLHNTYIRFVITTRYVIKEILFK